MVLFLYSLLFLIFLFLFSLVFLLFIFNQSLNFLLVNILISFVDLFPFLIILFFIILFIL